MRGEREKEICEERWREMERRERWRGERWRERERERERWREREREGGGRKEERKREREDKSKRQREIETSCEIMETQSYCAQPNTLSSAKRSGISCSSQMCPSTQSAAARSVVSLRLSEISLQSGFRHLSPLMQEIVTEYAQKQPSNHESNANNNRSSTIALK